MVGERLRAARKAAGYSLRDLEAHIDGLVTAQALGKYERDEMMPSSGVLMALSDALSVSEDHLLGQGTVVLDSLEFRRRPETPKKAEARIEWTVLQWLGRYLDVEDLLQVAVRRWETPWGGGYPVKEPSAAEMAAKGLRESWALGRDHMLNLAEFLEERGIKVLCHPLPEGVSGLMCWVRTDRVGRVPVIVVNETDTGERQRFTLAHELGHMALDVEKNVDREKAAYRFASSFLMPAEILLTEVGRKRTSLSLGELFVLKGLFGLSVQAITYRCRELGIIDQSEYVRLFRTFKDLGWRDPPYSEPAPVPKERSSRLKRLCFRALAEGVVSASRAAELLGVTPQQFRQLLDGPVSEVR